MKWCSLLRQTISLQVFQRLSSTNFTWSSLEYSVPFLHLPNVSLHFFWNWLLISLNIFVYSSKKNYFFLRTTVAQNKPWHMLVYIVWAPNPVFGFAVFHIGYTLCFLLRHVCNCLFIIYLSRHPSPFTISWNMGNSLQKINSLKNFSTLRKWQVSTNYLVNASVKVLRNILTQNET